MRALMCSVWIALGARQEGVLAHAHSLKPGDAFLALACLALRVALISLGCEVVAFGLVWCAWSSLPHFPRAPALLASVCNAFFPLGKRLYFAVVLFSVSQIWSSPNRLHIAGQTIPEIVAGLQPIHDSLTLWYIALSKTGKSVFNELKCWTWAIRNCGDRLSRPDRSVV